ncbi:MAG: 4Fe-4S cluster-binding domain-containing protein, partial [Proteobacteria bacterium]|nr:4Fe-4S cluster-binding domain-containing protein [Pseudomonadota bacterium]
MKGLIFDISRSCYEDGPGLRTVVFLKGCPLDCPWCHNLEGKSFAPEIAFAAPACIACGKCREACPREIKPE